MTTTNETLTDDRIRLLSTAAAAAGDHAMVLICDLAIDGEIDVDTHHAAFAVGERDKREIRQLDQDGARAKCLETIQYGEQG